MHRLTKLTLATPPPARLYYAYFVAGATAAVVKLLDEYVEHPVGGTSIVTSHPCTCNACAIKLTLYFHKAAGRAGVAGAAGVSGRAGDAGRAADAGDAGDEGACEN